jgi:hypothetical protein
MNRLHLTHEEVYDIFRDIFHNEEDALAATIQSILLFHVLMISTVYQYMNCPDVEIAGNQKNWWIIVILFLFSPVALSNPFHFGHN